jgi:translation initiation factor 3 subunit I
MRPLLLKGHERSITDLKYNREGDLLWTTSKHPSFAVWYASNGERLGTYDGHTGAVWSVDIDRHTERVITGSADNSARMWVAETGKEMYSWPHKAPVRSVNYAVGEKQFLSVTDQVLGYKPTVYVWDLAQRSNKPVIEFIGRNEAKLLQAMWSPQNDYIFTANEDGTIRVYDVRKNGEQLHVINEHTKAVMQISYSKDHLFFVSASKDGTAKLFDTQTFKCLKVYNTGRPVNTACISPLKEEVITGGGQSAESVTTTRVDSSQFKVRFWHMIYEEELGSIAGHFGPVNVVSFSPDGEGFASGGEDGYIRLHHFDPDYFTSFGKDDQLV